MKTRPPLPIAAIAFLLSLSSLDAADLKQIQIDFDEWSEGEPPDSVLVVDGTVEVRVSEAGKALVIDPYPITDANAQLGESAAGEATVEAKVLATKVGRSYPRFGVSVHGMSGHRLILNVPYRRLEIVKRDEVVAEAPFKWESGAWLRLKLEARRAEGSEDSWVIAGKAWADGSEEPEEPQLTASDEGLKGQGKCAIWGTPFAETPIFFDDLRIQVEAKAD
jgi:hypothetical protein